MKRDMDLVRRILLWIEQQDEYIDDVPKFDDVEPEVVMYHCMLLAEAHLVEAMDASNNVEPWYYIPTRLTWSGHEFVDAARADTVWKSAKERLLAIGGTVSLEVMMQILKQLVKVKLGIDSD